MGKFRTGYKDGIISVLGEGDVVADGLVKLLTADVTNATDVMANLTELAVNVESGTSYAGVLVINATNSTAAEGIKIDFDGGTCSAGRFNAAGGMLAGGTIVTSVAVSSALTTDLIWTTITSETWLVIQFGIQVEGGGTLIPRAAENTDGGATLTVTRGSTIRLERV